MIKVSEETIAEIVKRYQAGETPTALAREFKVAKSSVYRWINERTRTRCAICHKTVAKRIPQYAGKDEISAIGK